MRLSGWEIPLLLFVFILLFGARRLPDLARSVGKSMRILKEEVGPRDEGTEPTPPQPGSRDAGDDKQS